MCEHNCNGTESHLGICSGAVYLSYIAALFSISWEIFTLISIVVTVVYTLTSIEYGSFPPVSSPAFVVIYFLGFSHPD